jgi:hypothetical protein
MEIRKQIRDAGGIIQAAGGLPSKLKALSSNPSTAKNQKNQKDQHSAGQNTDSEATQLKGSCST